MKTLLAFLLAATLCFAEPAAPAGASAPDEPPHAESAEAKSHAESAESAEPAAPRAAEPQAAKPPLRAEVSLIDGSVLKGALRQRAIPARSPNLGEIRVRLGKVESIAFGKPGAPAKIAFQNGDALSARFPDDRAFVTMDTLVGRVRVPFDKVVSLSIEQPHSALSTQHSALLYHCTFDSQAAVEHPAAGPSGRFLGGSFVSGKFGRALRVEADTPAFESKLPKGFLGPEGCLEFWAKIEGDDLRYVDGGDPLFVSLYDERRSITLLQFAANNGFGRGGLGGAMAGWPFGTIPHSGWSMEYRKVLGSDWADWHHYAMSWKAGGFGDGSFVKVFVDGRPQPVLGGVDDDKVPARLADYGNHAYDLGIPWHASSTDRRRSKKPFLVDDLKIWSVAKTEFACARSDRPIQHSAFSTRHPEILYHCTFDDAQSIEHPATGPAGTFLGGEFVPGKVDNALRTLADAPTAEVDFEPGTLGPRGTIEFWAKKENGASSESEGLRFFGLWLYAMGETPPWCSTHFEFSSNDGMGMSGLCGMVNHCSWATNPSFGGWPYGLIRDSLTDWHHYAVVWDAEGLSGTTASDGGPAVVAVFLDGKPVSTQGRQTVSFGGKHLKAIPGRFAKLAFPTPSNGWGSSGDHVPFLIDDFKIWSGPKTTFDLL